MSPYLIPNRLQDIVGALQIMGSAKKYKRSSEEWADKIENAPLSAQSWDDIFKQHPEFFRDSGKGEGKSNICIMWRKGLPHYPGTDERQPLDPSQIMALMDTAIQFYSQAQEEMKDKRWWFPIGAMVLSFIGAVLGAYITTIGN